MKTIIVSDVFGLTPALKTLALEINSDAVIVTPYASEETSFDEEKEAYQYFVDHVGHKSYADKLKEQINQFEDALIVIGFSVGASAIWSLSENESTGKVKKAICFYGSQIRNSVNIQPAFPIELVFPLEEKHFSVQNLMRQLSDVRNTKVRQVPYLHGFMNAYSMNFNIKGYEEELSLLYRS